MYNVGVPDRKMCEIEARRRGLRRRRPNSPQEYMGMPLPTTSSDMECYSDNIHVCSIDCWDECHKPHFCPQLRVMGKKDESTNVVYMCNDCPQIPPPPPPPPPRKCCDRDPDLTQKYQDSCPKNPDGPKFPVPADSCILARKRQKFLERERKKQLGVGKPQPDMYMDESNCQANPEPIRGANACYYQGIDEQLPTPSAIDALPGYRPVRQAMVQSQPKSMRDWVKIAGNRPAMNCKNYKPY